MNFKQLQKKPHVRLMAIVLILLAVTFILWFVFGKQVGQECSGDFDCFGFGTFCLSTKGSLQRYCTSTCDDDSDCPDGFACRSRPIFDKHKVSLSIEKICLVH